MARKPQLLGALTFLFVCLTPSPSRADLQDALRTTAAASGQAARASSPQVAMDWAGRGFDGKSSDPVYVSPPLLAKPRSAELGQPTGNMIEGDPSRATFREPKSPLTVDEKPKPQKSGYGMLWAVGGALALGGIGFLLGGPIGAGIGFLLGGVLGAVFRK